VLERYDTAEKSGPLLKAIQPQQNNYFGRIGVEFP